MAHQATPDVIRLRRRAYVAQRLPVLDDGTADPWTGGRDETQLRPESTVAALRHLDAAGTRGIFHLDDLRDAWREQRDAGRDIEAQYRFQAGAAA